MRIGLTGFGTSVEQVVRQAERAEADGFAALWYPSAVLGDPLVAMALAGRATSSIELGTAVLPSYTCHPVLQAGRATGTAAAIGGRRFTLGIGPSHRPVIQDRYGMSFATPGRHTEEYIGVLAPLLRGEAVSFDGQEYRVRAQPPALPEGGPVPLLLAALGPRLLRVAGQRTAGTILWMGTATAIEKHVAPRIREAAAAAGRAQPRIVAGLPVAVHDDVAEARAEAASVYSVYGTLPNYQRILAHGGVAGPGDAVLVGDEAAVEAGIRALFEAGATDVWAAPFPVGDDRSASRKRTRALLTGLAAG
ncbi:TIGR03564 family F420-dependent LLM class oxidoreductase [Pseudonocardia humida]|uniref:TIGR03564 family F420-dependent LLM class oxidoreductase n=1 Tax=Pseudonocardia humida TaxID=2800819 RepID=A0ABT0ZSQ6_9PSEU|nr:TIGR03564 family F420-dependent LLM class oxidoreductase [Pseudonocardia humida]MCO1653752.1 TIGR03564 family F420-dependent LLM class oxidoreductase [Pseudonocardia humida]